MDLSQCAVFEGKYECLVFGRPPGMYAILKTYIFDSGGPKYKILVLSLSSLQLQHDEISFHFWVRTKEIN